MTKLLFTSLSALLAVTSFTACLQDGDTDPGDQTAVDTEDLQKNLCGPTPKAPTCNLPVCTADGWQFNAVAFGTTCTGAYGPSLCDGGKPDASGTPTRLGQCGQTEVYNPYYKVVGVIYAPPGFGGDETKASTVAYSAASALASETKLTNSYKSGTTVSSSLKISGVGIGSGISLTTVDSNGLTVSESEADSETVTTSQTLGNGLRGGATDGIDHDRDAIVLWLNPRLVAIESPGEVVWDTELNPDTWMGTTRHVISVTIGQLKDPSTFEAKQLQDLQLAGITPADYPILMSYDPLVNGGSIASQGARFRDTGQTYGYLFDTVTANLILQDSNAVGSDGTVSSDYTVGFTQTLGNDVFGVTKSTTLDFTYTDESTTTSTTTNTGTLNLNGHSAAYNGPVDLRVYVDKLFNTFAFELVAPPTTELQGSVYLKGGGTPVTLTASTGAMFKTTTDFSGNFHFPQTPVIPKGIASVTAVGQTKQVMIDPASTATVNFTLVRSGK